MKRLLTIAAVLIVGVNSAVAQRAEWRLIQRTEPAILKDIDGYDRQHFAVVGLTNIEPSTFLMITSDGGLSWTEVTVDQFTRVPLHLAPMMRALSYPAPGVIVMSGDDGTLFATTNGGLSFERRDITRGTMSIVAMVDSNRGVASHYRGVLLTDNCWQTWRELELPDTIGHDGIGNLTTTPGGEIIANIPNLQTGRRHLVRLSGDGEILSIVPAPPDMRSLSMSRDGILAAAGGKQFDPEGHAPAQVLISRDTGVTWQKSLDTLAYEQQSFSRLEMVDSVFAVASGPMGMVWSTRDGGRTWQADTAMYAPDGMIAFSNVRCFDDYSCFAAMGMNFIYQRFPATASISPYAAGTSGHVSAFPNPASTIFALTVDEQLSPNTTITVVDALGSSHGPSIRRTRFDRPSEWQIDVSSMTPGLYFVRVVDGDRVISTKLQVR